MSKPVPDILARIVDRKKEELQHRVTGIELAAESQTELRRDFRAALESRLISVIAEIKKASPSKGIICPDFDPTAIAHAYERGGASALSVLTDRDYFQGSLEFLKAARDATALPVLRKDFTIDEYQIHEAAAHGADAILLIVACLGLAELIRFRELAERYRMAALVEVHDEDELQLALDSGAYLIGVNSRDLRTFEVSLDTALRLAERMPAGVFKIAESGIGSVADVARLHSAGYRGFLVGEHLMRSGNPEAAVRELLECS